MAPVSHPGLSPGVAALSSRTSFAAPLTLWGPRRRIAPVLGSPLRATAAASQNASLAASQDATLAGPKPQIGQVAETFVASPRGAESESPTGGLKLACPICHRPLDGPGAAPFHLGVASRRKFRCGQCKRGFESKEGFIDCVISSGARDYLEPNLGWGGSSTFQNPVVSFVYERGWRQNFRTAGFPGPDEEWAMAREALRGAEGEAVVDISCGSGLFTRRMVTSGLFSLVVGLDYSESMLRQSKEYIQGSVPSLPLDRIALVRADVARLPFETGSVAGIHAGAALHCWPSPHLAVAEISRVLRPGGVFVATTFLSPSLPLADDLVKPFRKAAVSNSRVMKYWEPEELEELFGLCGLEGYQSDRRSNFIFLSARKALQAE